ncbi:response regulator (plasmid) [Azospirillum brasilense]|uniref:Response regulator n=2 Tax=Azospirillum brasilense TaxID=192 RepID=A0A4D8RDS3_AZOBR|nr:response regulator [Azospirillum brasilense]
MHVRGIILRNKPDWTVIEAANSAELYGKLHESDIHIAIIDFNMPGDNGLEAAARLLQAKPDIRVAIITANAQDSVVSGIRALGAAFMPKPLEEEQMARFLTAASLPRRPSPASSSSNDSSSNDVAGGGAG